MSVVFSYGMVGWVVWEPTVCNHFIAFNLGCPLALFAYGEKGFQCWLKLEPINSHREGFKFIANPYPLLWTVCCVTGIAIPSYVKGLLCSRSWRHNARIENDSCSFNNVLYWLCFGLKKFHSRSKGWIDPVAHGLRTPSATWYMKLIGKQGDVIKISTRGERIMEHIR